MQAGATGGATRDDLERLARDAEPELLRVRNLALWLSRISMPASYALIYSLSALLPSLS